MGSQRVGHDWATLTSLIFPLGENGTSEVISSFVELGVGMGEISKVTLSPHSGPYPFFCLLSCQCEKWKYQSLRHVWLFVTPWTVACQAPLSMEFSRQEYWNGLPSPSPEDLPDTGIEPGSPALQADALPSEPPWKPACSLNSELLNPAKFAHSSQSLHLLWAQNSCLFSPPPNPDVADSHSSSSPLLGCHHPGESPPCQVYARCSRPHAHSPPLLVTTSYFLLTLCLHHYTRNSPWQIVGSAMEQCSSSLSSSSDTLRPQKASRPTGKPAPFQEHASYFPLHLLYKITHWWGSAQKKWMFWLSYSKPVLQKNHAGASWK